MITAIGNPVYDYIKTRKIDTKDRVLSGGSTNAALALRRLGEEVRLIGAVGPDRKAEFVAQLKEFDIAYKLLPSDSTGGFSLVYHDDFGNRTLDLLGRAANIDEIRPEWYRDSKAVLIGPILGEVSFDRISEIRSSFDGLFVCDPQGLLRNADESDRIFHDKPVGIEQALAHFDIVKPNELEGQVLTGIDCREDPYQAARIIRSWGPKLVLLTLAELGSLVYDGEQFIDVPAFPVDLLDSTGAGDTYMAGFTFEYLKTGGDLKRAACFASSVSSIMIEQVGPGFVLKEDEVRRRQKQLLARTDFRLAVGANE